MFIKKICRGGELFTYWNNQYIKLKEDKRLIEFREELQ